MPFILPPDVEHIISKYEENGYTAHIVGGPVRDYLLGIPPHDFDLTTDATPEETKEIFRDCHIIDTGIKHGTVTLVLSGTPYEITTYRIDGEYTDNRHPSEITFTRSLAEDLSRRDFTVNAMAYSPNDGLVDLFGGREDLKNKIIRAVGDPERRFTEDALRILRAMRFSSRLGFTIEDNTSRAIFTHAHLMRSLAVERVMEELGGILKGKYACEILNTYASALSFVFPELALAFRSLTALPSAEKEDDPFLLRLIYLAYKAALSRDAYLAFTERMHTSRQVRLDGALVLSHIDTKTESEYDISKLLSGVGAPLAHLVIALRIHEGKTPTDTLAILKHLLATHRPYRISDLAVSGVDLAPLGYSGKALGDALAHLLDAVMHSTVENEKNALLLYLAKEK